MSKEVIYTELYSKQASVVDTLFKIYEKDKFKARVYYMNESSHLFKKYRLGIFDEPNGDFGIVYFERKYGISKTNKMYNRETRIYSIIKKGNKFYYKSGKNIRLLMVGQLKDSQHSSLIIPEIIKRLPWFRYLSENNILRNTTLNAIYSKKIFSLEKALRHQYKLPLPSAKLLNKTPDGRGEYVKHYLEYMYNVENLHNTLPTYDFGLFYDTLKMAKTLDKKVNCSWSMKRLKLEHDAWTKEITDVVFVDGNRDLAISKIYIDFSDKSGYKLLRTTKEMAYEGLINKHCVATYVSKVESGNCGIYHIDGYTLELISRWSGNKLEIRMQQFRGYNNCEAPKELTELVKNKLDEFNNRTKDDIVEDSDVFDIDEVFNLF